MIVMDAPTRHHWTDAACENCWDSPEIDLWGGVKAEPPTFYNRSALITLDIVDHMIVMWPREVLARDFLYLCEL
jgi:hypothetical protein